MEHTITPKHIAIIMDGNGRWAKTKGVKTIEGHRAGVDAAKRTVKAAKKLGLTYLTLYTFSTENWKRPQTWIRDLFSLMEHFLDSESNLFIQEEVRVHIIGDISKFPGILRSKMLKLVDATKHFTGLQVNIALGYGSRDEITRAVRTIINEGIHAADITEETISKHLDTAGIPDPDILIRPSGEMRISNYLLWQLAYTELYFDNVLWPDFEEKHLMNAIHAFSKRDRRFGG